MTRSGRPTALVTGASRGIGRATAIALAAAGYDVAITARTVSTANPARSPETGEPLPGSLEETAAAIEATGGRAVAVALDLLDLDAIEARISEAIRGLGHLDVLVNNAIHMGADLNARLLDASPQGLIDRVTGNVTAQMLITQVAVRHMLNRAEAVDGVPADGVPADGALGERAGGTVINVSSAAGQHTPHAPVGEGGWALSYSVTKAGFHRIADMLALEYGDAGIRAINVNPGFVATERVLAAGADLDFVARRGVAPAVVGAAIAWLASEAGVGEVANGGYVHLQPLAARLGLSPAK